MAPKAFISHTSVDKDLWARPLAIRLRELGVDAWFDEWEISGGDSIVQKVFSSGIEKSDAVIVVLSENSIVMPWVNAELDVAVVRNIERLLRLIPVKVDGCIVPTALSATHYLSIERYGDIDRIAKEIAAVLYGVTKAPPLGPTPVYVTQAAIELPGLSQADAFVLEKIYNACLDDDGGLIRTGLIARALEADGVDGERLLESLEVLAGTYYITDVDTNMQGQTLLFSLTTETVLAIAGSNGLNVDSLRCLVATNTLNCGNHGLDLEQLCVDHDVKKLHVWAVTKEFADQDLIYWFQSSSAGLGGSRTKKETLLRRWANDHCG